jgi:tRNA (guanosine-2'-O-)-methyltransferase
MIPEAHHQQYLEYLQELITAERLQKMREVLKYRTRFLTVVIEDIYQPHNASAVLRSCECFGVLDVHIIENRNTYQVNPDVALGASKWINIHRYNAARENTQECIDTLREKGYRIVAATPHVNDCFLEDLPMTRPTAIVLGNEKEGLSSLVTEQADAFVKIPMFGFTESFNISVSAALCLYSLTASIHQGSIPWQLSEAEQRETLIQWIENTIKHPDTVRQGFIKRFLK